MISSFENSLAHPRSTQTHRFILSLGAKNRATVNKRMKRVVLRLYGRSEKKKEMALALAVERDPTRQTIRHITTREEKKKGVPMETQVSVSCTTLSTCVPQSQLNRGTGQTRPRKYFMRVSAF